MISSSTEELQGRAQQWVDRLGRGEVISGLSTVGGGSLPGETLPTYLAALDLPSPNRFLEALRNEQPPVIARLEEDRVVFDPRTILLEQEPLFLDTLERALNRSGL
jgi:L-seryl-tRNA(Ser) seleniumtransferase